MVTVLNVDHGIPGAGVSLCNVILQSHGWAVKVNIFQVLFRSTLHERNTSWTCSSGTSAVCTCTMGRPESDQHAYRSSPSQSPFQTMYMCNTPESTPPSKDILSFSTNLCVRPSTETTPPSQNIPPLFNNYTIMRPFQNLPLPIRIFFTSGGEW